MVNQDLGKRMELFQGIQNEFLIEFKKNSFQEFKKIEKFIKEIPKPEFIWNSFHGNSKWIH